ncbi:MAG: dUTP diphosphatase [Rickettsiaceae bacterium]
MNTNIDVKIEVMKLPHAFDLPLPSYATEHSAGMDLLAAIEGELVLSPNGGIALVSSGIAIALPIGFEAQVRPRSGLAAKHGITVLNSPGTIDSDYRGEVKVLLINHGNSEFKISRAMRIAQLVIGKYERVDWTSVDAIDQTKRGVGGFGSTGS